jgi:hypothetical protein
MANVRSAKGAAPARRSSSSHDLRFWHIDDRLDSADGPITKAANAHAD